MVAELEAKWGLTNGPPYVRGTAAWTAPATSGNGEPAVLKVSWPHREARYEADGLRSWAGVGAVRLLKSDESRWALLVERCTPGQPLHESGLTVPEALAVAGELLRSLWSTPVAPGAPFERLREVAAEWAALVLERMDRHRPPFDRGLVALGATLLETLQQDASPVLLHGDFNPGNILSAGRLPFLAIDPKPMIGDAAYDGSQLLDQLDDAYAGEEGARTIRARYRRFADLVGVPAERMLAWGVARKVEGALWDFAEGRPQDGERGMHGARVLADAGAL